MARNSSSNDRRSWCVDWLRMYSATAFTFEALTLKAPYPCCHEKRCPESFIHRDEAALSSRTTPAMASRGGNDTSAWTWSAVPPMAWISNPSALAISWQYDQSFGWITGTMFFLRWLVQVDKVTGVRVGHKSPKMKCAGSSGAELGILCHGSDSVVLGCRIELQVERIER